MKKKQVNPDDFIELMTVDEVCKYVMLSKSSLNKRSRDPADPFPPPEWLGRKRVWRAKIIREFVFNSLTSERPDHHLAGGPPVPRKGETRLTADQDSLKFGEDHPRSERAGR